MSVGRRPCRCRKVVGIQPSVKESRTPGLTERVAARGRRGACRAVCEVVRSVSNERKASSPGLKHEEKRRRTSSHSRPERASDLLGGARCV
jgi:hypothetical protein